MTRLHVPDHVRESPGAHGGAVLLDARSGHCFALNPVAGLLWQEWRRSRDFETGVRVTARQFPEPCQDLIRRDARRLADALLDRGLLATCPTSGPPAPAAGDRSVTSSRHGPGPDHGAGTSVRGPVDRAPAPVGERRTAGGAEVDMAADLPADPSREGRSPVRRTLPVGLLGLLVALVLIRLPFRTLLRVVRWTLHRWCRQEATAAQAAAALATVRQAAARYPGRAACLETSLASLVLLALSRRRVTWCIGTAADPCRFHAWIQAQDVPITAADEHGIEAFRGVLTV
ncbi:lasso peptide biosynthesis B2 protein [Streptomyces sp. NPDC014991]|uniref:lasso peptide biosynthesis B2 protein n=1 Tax=Streptomyces sp. NPDC014991 TaxID=3364935 RepID=UPI0036FA19CC